MKAKNKYGLFIYKINKSQEGCDECIYRQYFSNKKKAVARGREIKKDIKQDEYLEVWQKENGYWGASGEPIYKSDI